MDARGYLLDRDWVKLFVDAPPETRNDPRYLDIRDLPSHGAYALPAIRALRQRWVVEHFTPTRWQRREAERKHRVRLNDYYLLQAAPSPQDAGQAQRPAATRRGHVVSGHFRWSLEEHPALGGGAGMIWVPARRPGRR